MRLEPDSPPTAAAGPAAPSAHGKPASASCCHVLALLCFLGGAAALFLAFTQSLPPMIALWCFAAGVVWWALGDIVAGVDRIARK